MLYTYTFYVTLRAQTEEEIKLDPPTCEEMADWYDAQINDIIDDIAQSNNTQVVTREWTPQKTRCNYCIMAPDKYDAKSFADLISDPDDDGNYPLNHKWLVVGRHSVVTRL